MTLMEPSTRSGTEDTLEWYRGEIFLLYIIQKKTANEVIATLKHEYDLSTTPKVLKTKLGQWDFTKNVKRGDVVQVVHNRTRGSGLSASVGKDYTLTLRRRPVNLKQVEKHRKRAGIAKNRQEARLIPTEEPIKDDLSKNLAPLVSSFLPEHWRTFNRLLFDIDILIKGSFEAGLWMFNGNDHLIKSANCQDLEIRVLHDFLCDFAIGCHTADSGDLKRAGIYWRQAFLQTETLVKSQYYDVIPNLFQKVNDLNRQGYRQLAVVLKTHSAEVGKRVLSHNAPTWFIFDGLGSIDVDMIIELEEQIMRLFAEVFELYLGCRCYNSFVMIMDAARRRLLQCSWVTLDCLPDLSQLERDFGPTDRRCLDVIGLRAEISSFRGNHVVTEVEASLLIQRAELIQRNDWQRFYNLTRGWYFLGSAQYFLSKRALATQSLSNALHSDDELCKIDEFHIFNAERTIMLKYLAHLKSYDWIKEEEMGDDRTFLGSSEGPVAPLDFFRCCKEPMRPTRV